MRYKKAKKALMFWCLFVSIGAIYGSTLMFINPTGKLLGMEELLPYFKVLPFSDKLFQNYIFSGISLLIVNGISNLIAFYYLLKNKKAGIILGSIFGFTLMLWITIQFIILPLNVLSISFFIIGIIQLLTGYMTLVFYLQENFKIDLKKYIYLGNGMSEANKTIIADVFEATMAVIYLENGLNAVKRVFHELIVPYIDRQEDFLMDYKSLLQESVQTVKKSVEYKLIDESGPAHNKTFKVEVIIDGLIYGVGSGSSKKEAEQNAAKEAYNKRA